MTKVLFVEDDKSWARRYIENLEEKGFVVLHVLDGNGAVEIAEQVADLAAVILDIQMPIPRGVAPHEVEDGHTTGLWVLDQIREHVVPRPMPIFVLTNLDLTPLREKIEEVRNRSEACYVPGKFVEVHAKTDVSAKALPARLRALIGKCGRGGGQREAAE